MFNNFFKSALLVGFLVFCDQITKYWAFDLQEQPLQFFDWFKLVYAENRGIAWSLPVPQVLLLILTPFLVFAGMYYLRQHRSSSPTLRFWTLGLFVAGALGNWLDRVFRGFVVDFIAVGWWPIFNLADIYISLSVFLILIFHDRIIGSLVTKNASK